MYHLHGAKLVLQKCQISNLSYSSQILYFTLFPLTDNTVLAIAGGAGGGGLLLVVIIGVLLCVLVMRKVCHAATKSQSKLCTLWGFFQPSFLSTDIYTYVQSSNMTCVVIKQYHMKSCNYIDTSKFDTLFVPLTHQTIKVTVKPLK